MVVLAAFAFMATLTPLATVSKFYKNEARKTCHCNKGPLSFIDSQEKDNALVTFLNQSTESTGGDGCIEAFK